MFPKPVPLGNPVNMATVLTITDKGLFIFNSSRNPKDRNWSIFRPWREREEIQVGFNKVWYHVVKGRTVLSTLGEFEQLDISDFAQGSYLMAPWAWHSRNSDPKRDRRCESSGLYQVFDLLGLPLTHLSVYSENKGPIFLPDYYGEDPKKKDLVGVVTDGMLTVPNEDGPVDAATISQKERLMSVEKATFILHILREKDDAVRPSFLHVYARSDCSPALLMQEIYRLATGAKLRALQIQGEIQLAYLHVD